MATNTKTDPREMPGYSTVEAAHYLRIPLATLRVVGARAGIIPQNKVSVSSSR